MNPSAVFRMADRVLCGRLEEKLRRWKRARVSSQGIARMLTEDLGTSISGETVRRWLRDLERDPDIENGDEGAAA